MPELDGVSILALASFGALIVAWLFAPKEHATVIVARRTEAAAA